MKFEAHEIALVMIQHIRPIVEVVQRHDPDLAKQMRRAAQSAPLNIGEGSQRSGKDRVYHYRVARGSAREALNGVRIAEAWGYVSESATVKCARRSTA